MIQPKVAVFDLEAAGVQGLKADRGVMTHFGYKWLGRGRREVISIHDFNGWKRKDGLDDTGLLKEASKIMGEAEALIAHFGEYFDKPYADSRFIQAGLPIIPPMKLTDTCLIAKRRLCLSSNSLKNLAIFLKCDITKMEKGRGWPDWWMGALYGHVESLEKMRVYCGFDVLCLEEVYYKLRSVMPLRDLPFNYAIGAETWTCPKCGGHRRQYRGTYYTDKRAYPRFVCISKLPGGRICGSWDRDTNPIAVAYKQPKDKK